jgi:hypothetical protein
MAEDEMRGATGRCLCGAVRFHAPAASAHVHACHCAMCRRWGGGPAFAVACASEVVFEEDAPIGYYRSSDWAERAFCSQCGSGLFYRYLPTGALMLNAGLLYDQTALRLTEQIFVDDKPGWYDLANDTPMKTGAEAVAEFTGGAVETP